MPYMLSAKKESKWDFKTNATGGIGAGLAVASGGLIVLTTPNNLLASFHYGGIGVGLSIGGKLPKIPKLPKIDLKGRSGSGSTTNFDSHGAVYIMEGCKKDELDATDFEDPCVYLDAGAGAIVGYSGTAMLAGISSMALLKAGLAGGLIPGALVDPIVLADVLSTAQALILMRGWNAGLQMGGGVSISIGYLHLSKIVGADNTCVNNSDGVCLPWRISDG